MTTTATAIVNRNEQLDKLWGGNIEVTDPGNRVKVKFKNGQDGNIQYEHAVKVETNITILSEKPELFPFHKALESEIDSFKELKTKIDERFENYTGTNVSALLQRIPFVSWFLQSKEEIIPEFISMEAARFSQRVSYHEKFIKEAKEVAVTYQKVIEVQRKVIENLRKGEDKLIESQRFRIPMQLAGQEALLKEYLDRLKKIEEVVEGVDLIALNHSLSCFRKIAQHGRPLTSTQRFRYAVGGTTPIIEKK